MDFIKAIRGLAQGRDHLKALLREKRSIPRIPCDIKAFTFIGGIKTPLRITDLSLGGVRANCYVRLAGDFSFPLYVQLSEIFMSRGMPYKDNVLVKVSWCRKKKQALGFTLGLSFIDCEENIRNSWVHYMFEQLGIQDGHSFQKRDCIRVPIDISAPCTDSKGKIIDTTVKNIGLGGILLSSDEEIVSGDSIDLLIGPMKKYGTLKLKGLVTRSEYSGMTGKWLIGIEFTRIGRREFRTIGRMILDSMKSQK